MTLSRVIRYLTYDLRRRNCKGSWATKLPKGERESNHPLSFVCYVFRVFQKSVHVCPESLAHVRSLPITGRGRSFSVRSLSNKPFSGR